MNIALQTLPTHIDIIHLALAVIVLILISLLVVKRKPTHEQTDLTVGTPEENKKASPVLQQEDTPTALNETNPDGALQLLTLLQQEARFIDFIQEDLRNYDDADIGAAARVVHEGSKKTLNNYFVFSPIRQEEEESPITLEKGFNASEIRLTGNVIGEAPFSGILIHKGWKVTNSHLPKIAKDHDTSIIAPAEIEL